MDTANDSYLLRLEQGEANGQWLTPSMNDQSIIMNTIISGTYVSGAGYARRSMHVCWTCLSIECGQSGK